MAKFKPPKDLKITGSRICEERIEVVFIDSRIEINISDMHSGASVILTKGKALKLVDAINDYYDEWIARNL